MFASRGGSGPIVAAEAHHTLKARIVEGTAAVQDRVDGIYLALHGAEGCEDVEGDLLRSMRECVSPATRIAVAAICTAILSTSWPKAPRA
jgi:microcystin degradation protein MlrC